MKTDQTGRMPSWSVSSLGAHAILLVFSWHGSLKISVFEMNPAGAVILRKFKWVLNSSDLTEMNWLVIKRVLITGDQRGLRWDCAVAQSCQSHYYLLGLHINQISRCDICIDTKWPIFNISFDTLCKMRKIVVHVIITDITIVLPFVYIHLLCNFHTVYSLCNCWLLITVLF